MGQVAVDLVIPVKSLALAKSRLRGVAESSLGVTTLSHPQLVLAVVLDTVTAARSAAGVRRILVVSSDPVVAAALADHGVDSTPDGADLGLNAALLAGADALRRQDPQARVAALQADLPALRPADLAAALAEAGHHRAFCADRQGTGTTLLVAEAGQGLDPRFGPGSARAHAESAAIALRAPLPSLRCDVDTPDDLAAAHRIGVGPRTAALLGESGWDAPRAS
jgi:2-phospho-L-lactate guanylyltransferase